MQHTISLPITTNLNHIIKSQSNSIGMYGFVLTDVSTENSRMHLFQFFFSFLSFVASLSFLLLFAYKATEQQQPNEHNQTCMT